jgi:hypothetical protein
MKDVDPKTDEFGGKMLALLQEYGYNNFLVAGVNDDNHQGMCMSQTPEFEKGMTALTLLVLANSELFDTLMRLLLSSYISEVLAKIQGGQKPPTPAGPEFTAKGKLH